MDLFNQKSCLLNWFIKSKTLGGYLHSTVHSSIGKTKSHNQKFQASNFFRQDSTGASLHSAPVNNGANVWNKVFESNNEAGHTPLLANNTTLVTNNESNQAGKVSDLFFLLKLS